MARLNASTGHFLRNWHVWTALRDLFGWCFCCSSAVLSTMAAQEGTWDVTTRLQYTAFRQLQPHCVLKVYHQLHCRPEHRDLGILQVARQHATRVISFGCVNYQMLSDQAWLMEDLPEQMTYKVRWSAYPSDWGMTGSVPHFHVCLLFLFRGPSRYSRTVIAWKCSWTTIRK